MIGKSMYPQHLRASAPPREIPLGVTRSREEHGDGLDYAGIVRKAADIIEELVKLGFEPIGLEGNTPSGQPIIRISQPAPDDVGLIHGRAIWRAEMPNDPMAEIGMVGEYKGAVVMWSEFYLRKPLKEERPWALYC